MSNDRIREQRREYRNRARIAIRRAERAYYARNKERINERARERYRLSRLRKAAEPGSISKGPTPLHLASCGLWFGYPVKPATG